ncbi:hypothetical protein MJ390_22215 [Klebsiella pneumoniae]|nr:hypothetical protein MJ390_22215 [Klebsiella pneumoniae]
MGIKHVAPERRRLEHRSRLGLAGPAIKGRKVSVRSNGHPPTTRSCSELDGRLTIIDWVRDTINAPAEELGPEQLAQRAVDLLCAAWRVRR